jgi:phosphoglycerate dehydrogenase-like enzyme
MDVVRKYDPDFIYTDGNSTQPYTARPPIVCQEEMIEVLRRRPDLTAVLDVCEPEPLPESSPLLSLENVVVSSHIAGSHEQECQRLGSYMVEEFRRYLNGEPLRWQITREIAARLA